MASNPALSGRYVLDEPWAAGGIGERFHARDAKLDRTVLAWVYEAPEGDPDREALLELARRAGRLSHPAYLRILDAAPEAERLTIALQAPEVARAADDSQPARLPALVAVALVLEVAAALEDAATLELQPRRLPATALHLERDAARLDPIEVFGRTERDDELPARVALLCDLLGQLLPEEGAPGGRFDPGLGAVRAVHGRWRERAADGDDDTVAFTAELRQAAVPEGLGQTRQREVARRARTAAPVSDADRDLPTAELPTMALPLSGVEATAAPARRRPARPRREPTQPIPVQRGTAVTREVSRDAPVRRGLPRSAFVLAAASVLLFTAGLVGYGMTRQGDGANATAPPPTAEAAQPAPPPPGRVGVTVRAQEDSLVRATVDGTVAFDGVMRAGETKAWEGGQRVQVYTDKGRSLLITINGHELGPYSPAMGHPDWNRIDFGFGPGWQPSSASLQPDAGSQPISIAPSHDDSGDDGDGNQRNPRSNGRARGRGP